MPVISKFVGQWTLEWCMNVCTVCGTWVWINWIHISACDGDGACTWRVVNGFGCQDSHCFLHKCQYHCNWFRHQCVTGMILHQSKTLLLKFFCATLHYSLHVDNIFVTILLFLFTYLPLSSCQQLYSAQTSLQQHTTLIDTCIHHWSSLMVAVVAAVSSHSVVWLHFVGDTTLPPDQSYFLSVDDAKDYRHRDRKVTLLFKELP